MLKFGTDGVRGVANAELTPELALALGRAAARVLGGDRFAIGRDTRLSGPMLEAALCAGLVSEGVDVELLGVAPTPEVAWWSVTADAPAATSPVSQATPAAVAEVAVCATAPVLRHVSVVPVGTTTRTGR